jgi:hypothetical protein
VPLDHKYLPMFKQDEGLSSAQKSKNFTYFQSSMYVKYLTFFLFFSVEKIFTMPPHVAYGRRGPPLPVVADV